MSAVFAYDDWAFLIADLPAWWLVGPSRGLAIECGGCSDKPGRLTEGRFFLTAAVQRRIAISKPKATELELVPDVSTVFARKRYLCTNLS